MTKITRTICIEPHMLDANIHSHILDKAIQEWQGKCTKDDGIIVKIISVDRIIDNYVSPATSGLNFVLSLNAETLKPKIGDIFTEEVKQITSRGIFINGDITVIVPAHTLSDYTFDKDEECFVGENRNIKTGDSIEISISAIKYENNKFKYIGNLKE